MTNLTGYTLTDACLAIKEKIEEIQFSPDSQSWYFYNDGSIYNAYYNTGGDKPFARLMRIPDGEIRGLGLVLFVRAGIIQGSEWMALAVGLKPDQVLVTHSLESFDNFLTPPTGQMRMMMVKEEDYKVITLDKLGKFILRACEQQVHYLDAMLYNTDERREADLDFDMNSTHMRFILRTFMSLIKAGEWLREHNFKHDLTSKLEMLTQAIMREAQFPPMALAAPMKTNR